MTDAPSQPTPRQTPPSSGRKSYHQPQLQVFGKLHLRTQGSLGTENDGMSTTRSPNMSDRRTKQDIVRIGDHAIGIGLYLFDYKPEFRDAWGRGRQFGVMADEVERVMPHAVAVHADGYQRVDYAMLGIARSVH